MTIGNPNPIKLGRCIKELERIYGIRDGSAGNSQTNNFTGNNNPKTEKELADRLGITQQTVQNYKKLTELVPELQDWVETGILALIGSVKHRTKWIERRKSADFKRFPGSLLLEIRLMNDKF